MRSGDFQNAQEIVQQFPTNSADSLLIEAEISLAKGQVDAAAEHVRNFIRLHRKVPLDSLVFFMLANLAGSAAANCTVFAQLLRFAHTHKVTDPVCALVAIITRARGCSLRVVLEEDGTDESAARNMQYNIVYPLTMSTFSNLYGNPLLNFFGVFANKQHDAEPLTIIARLCLKLVAPPSTTPLPSEEFTRQMDEWLEESGVAIEQALASLTNTFEITVASHYLALVQTTAAQGHRRALMFAKQHLASLREKVKDDSLSKIMVEFVGT